MIASIKKWFLRPYPFPTTYKSKFLISIGFGLFIFLFLLIFTPFNFRDLKDEVLYFALMYGIITTSILLLNLLLAPVIFTNIFNPNKWTIYKMIIYVLEIMLIISFANWFFSNLHGNFFAKKGNSFLFFITVTFLVGIFPLFIYVYITERVANKKYQNIADNISKAQKINQNSDNGKKQIIFVGENKREKLTLLLNDFLCISSEKNYANIIYLKDGEIKNVLFRTSLNKIEAQLSDYKSIVRCHKSYIVNTKQVEKIQGNARSYLLKIPKLDFLIPVSRNFPKELLFTLVT